MSCTCTMNVQHFIIRFHSSQSIKLSFTSQHSTYKLEKNYLCVRNDLKCHLWQTHCDWMKFILCDLLNMNRILATRTHAYFKFSHRILLLSSDMMSKISEIFTQLELTQNHTTTIDHNHWWLQAAKIQNTLADLTMTALLAIRDVKSVPNSYGQILMEMTYRKTILVLPLRISCCFVLSLAFSVLN